MSAESNVSVIRDVDLLTGESLSDAETIVDFGMLQVPGLFFPNAELASAAFSRVRLVKSVFSGLIQLDRNIDPKLYTYYQSGAVTPAHLSFVETLAESLSPLQLPRSHPRHRRRRRTPDACVGKTRLS
jgi:hypothetical protein